MRILIDFRPNNRTGIYRYGMEVIPWLLQSTKHTFIVFCTNEVEEDLRHHLPDGLGNHLFYTCDAYGFIRNSEIIKQAIAFHKVDLVYSVHYLLEHDIGVPFVFTIHDLLRLKNPDFSYSKHEFLTKYGPQELGHINDKLKGRKLESNEDQVFQKWFASETKLLAQQSKKIITVSESSKTDISSLLDIESDKISVSYCGVSHHFKKATQPARDEKPFFLYVGLAKKHKRLEWIIHRWKNVHAPMNNRFDLRIISNGPEIASTIMPLVERLELAGSIIMEGYVSNTRLAYLYNHAQCLLIASEEEGFCLPLAEALACQCPVIASDIPVIREISKGCANLVSLDDSYQYEQQIISVSSKERFMAPLKEHNFSWENVADTILRSFEI